MRRIVQHGPSGAVAPRLQSLRLFFLLVLIFSAILWPLSGLTVWHFLFSSLALISAYLSFSSFILPLMFYFPLLILYWVVAPMVQASAGVTFYMGTANVPSFTLDALLFSFIHLCGVFIGVLIHRKRRVTSPANGQRSLSLAGILISVVLLLLAIGMIGYDSIINIRTEQEEVESATRFAINFVKLVPAFILSYFLLSGRSKYDTGTISITFILLAVTMVFVSNPLNTPRFLSLFGVLIVGLIFLINTERLRLLAWTAALTPIYAVLLLAATSLMRFGFEEISFERMLLSLQSLEFSSYSVFLDALDVNFEGRAFFLSHLFILFPRAFWPEKEGSIGIFVAEQSGYVFNNVGLISFFNAYADYGVVGLFLVSVVFGFLTAKFNPLRSAPSYYCRSFIFGIMLTALTPMVVRGDLSTVVIGLSAAALAYECTRFLTKFSVRMK